MNYKSIFFIKFYSWANNVAVIKTKKNLNNDKDKDAVSILNKNNNV